MITTGSLQGQPLEELIGMCRREIHLYKQGQHPSTYHCYELFRRASTGDQRAWSTLYDLYYALVLTWIGNRDGATILSTDDQRALVNEAFAKFARNLSPTKFPNFASLPALLAYLKCCARSVTLDALRFRRAVQEHEATLDALECEPAVDDPADTVISQLCATHLWQALRCELNNDAERVLIASLYLQMKPIDVAQRYAGLFRDVEDVYRVRRNVIERLRRNRQLQTSLLKEALS